MVEEPPPLLLAVHRAATKRIAINLIERTREPFERTESFSRL